MLKFNNVFLVDDADSDIIHVVWADLVVSKMHIADVIIMEANHHAHKHKLKRFKYVYEGK
jgi:hypothetical protein